MNQFVNQALNHVRNRRPITCALLLIASVFITGCPTMAGNIAYLEPLEQDLVGKAMGPELARNCSPLLFSFVDDGLQALAKQTGKRSWNEISMVYEANSTTACLIIRGERTANTIGGEK